MVKVAFITHENDRYDVDAPAGQSLMETAISNDVPGIDADCGGACACATCHVFVTKEWVEKVGTADDMEASMLEFAENVRPSSRLSCQIELSDELDGLVVELPESQH